MSFPAAVHSLARLDSVVRSCFCFCFLFLKLLPKKRLVMSVPSFPFMKRVIEFSELRDLRWPERSYANNGGCAIVPPGVTHRHGCPPKPGLNFCVRP